MLKALLENDLFPASSLCDAFAARVQAYFSVYGAANRFASFWYQLEGGEVTALVCRVDGNAVLSCNERADLDELGEFFAAIGFSTLICDESVCRELGLAAVDSSVIAEYCGGAQGGGEISRECDMKALFALLNECGFDMGDYGSFLADYCARLNKNVAELLCKYDGDALAACASALFIGEKSVLLGAVASKPEFRGRGYASALVSQLACKYYPSKRVFIFCRNDSLAQFYKKIGFCPTGRWAIAGAQHN